MLDIGFRVVVRTVAALPSLQLLNNLSPNQPIGNHHGIVDGPGYMGRTSSRMTTTRSVK